MTNYDDIINMNRPVSKHTHQSIESRASQFAPFAALVGYGEKIEETARLTDKKIELDEAYKNILSEKLNFLYDNINENNEVTIIYFVKDKKKIDGKYIKKTGILKKIDVINEIIKFNDNSIINMNDIININGEILDKLFE